jgi:anti-anti-sigma factor
MTVHAVNGLFVLEPAGDLCEGAECDAMERELLGHAGQGHRVVVNLEHTRLLSARALGILARTHRSATANGGRLVVCGANRLQRFLLTATRLAEVLEVAEDEAAALRALGLAAA